MNKPHMPLQFELDKSPDAQESFNEFLDCHTSCYQTLLSVLGIHDKHVEVTRVLIVFDVYAIYEMIENLELYGQICKTCAKRASDVFGSLRDKKLLQKQENNWN